MKFLHVAIPSKRMMETYIKMIRAYYPEDEHTFYFLGKCPPSQSDLFQYGNVVELKEGRNKLEKIKNFYSDIQHCNYIIWHGLVLSSKFAIFLYFFRVFLKKSIWVMWGIDLYSFKRSNKGLKNRIINHINYKIRKCIKYPVAIFPTDIDAYKKIFNRKNTKVYYAPYPIREKVFKDMESLGNSLKRANGEIWVQIGNNANSFNRHIDILNALSKFANEKIKVFIPMSYGNDWHNKEYNYIDFVREKAIEIFGEKKVVILKNLMSIDEYSKFLEQIDIMIIATDRQNALGNILKNMYAGGKVFLSEANTLYDYFLHTGIKINKFEDIKKMDFSTFCEPVDNQKIKYWMIENHYPQINILYWDRLFNDLDIDHHKVLSTCAQPKVENILDEIKVNAKIHEKMNYVNYSRYMYKNNKMLKKIDAAKDVFIVGYDSSCVKIIQCLLHDNEINYKWNLMGIISENMIDLQDNAYGINTVATIENCQDYDSVSCINFCDDPVMRKRYFTAISKHKGQFESVILHNANIGAGFCYEEAFFLGTNSIISHNCKLGKFVKIGHNVIIGCNCRIGDYVTIGDNVVVGDNSVISDYAVVSK